MDKYILIDQVITTIKKDIENGDITALVVLLESVSDDNLKAFLPESE